MEFGGIDDIEYLKNRMMAALKVPKAFIGYEEGVEGKATLAQQDIRFARTVERIQKIVLSELTKIAIVHLYSQGYENEDLVNFELELTNPSIIYEQEKAALWTEKVSLVSSMKDLKMVSQEWMYRNIFNMSDDEWKLEQAKVINDLKLGFRHEQITQEGNDPVKTGESFGTPHDLAALNLQGQEEEGGSEEGGQPGAGRPEEGGTFGTDENNFGRDPLGSKTDVGTDSTFHKFRKSPFATESGNALKAALRKKKVKTSSMILESLKEEDSKQEIGMLDESNLLDDTI